MENSDGQPEPLNIVKRSRDTAVDRGSGYDINTQRMSSVDTNESMDSLCGFLDVNGSLTLPKRRRPQPPHGGGRRGAERVATLASKARRRLNVTDNLGANAETDNDQINAFRHGIGSRSRSGTTRYYSPASMQPQDLHTEGFDADVTDPRRMSKLVSKGHFPERDETKDAAVCFQRSKVAGMGDGHVSQFFGPEDVSSMTLGSTTSFSVVLDKSLPASWAPTPHRQRTPRFLAESGSLSHNHPTTLENVIDVQPICGKPVFSSPESDMDDRTSFLRYYERAATAIPFDGRRHHLHHEHRQKHQLDQLDQLDHFENFDDFDQFGQCRRGTLGLPPKPPALTRESDPRILVPIVSATPECRTIDGNGGSFWVAVELFAEAVRPLHTTSSRDHAVFEDEPWRTSSSFAMRPDQDLGIYRYGFISDMNIELLPSARSDIIEVIGKSPSLITFLPGSRRLMVVHVHLDTSQNESGSRAISSDYHSPTFEEDPDKLMEDLEFQLGATSQEYMRIRLTYTHSGFPKCDKSDASEEGDRYINTSIQDGVYVSMRTKIETTAIAVILQHNSSSVWSPSPTPESSPLVDIVAKHWGPAAALEMEQRIACSKRVRMARKPANPISSSVGFCAGNEVEEGEYGKYPAETGSHSEEMTPCATTSGQDQRKDEQGKRRQFSSRKASRKANQMLPDEQVLREDFTPLSLSLPKTENESRCSSPTKVRLASSQQRPTTSRVQRLLSSTENWNQGSPPSGCFPPRPKSLKLALEGPKKIIPNSVPCNVKKMVGMDTTNLQSLAQATSELNLNNASFDERPLVCNGNRKSSRSSIISKKSGKWSWTNWFS